MKESILKLLSLLLLAAMPFGLFSCVEQEGNLEDDTEDVENNEGGNEPVFEVRFKSATQTTAEIEINAENVKEIVYMLCEEQTEMTMHAVLFQDGTPVDAAAESVKLEDLDANKTYWVYFAAMGNDLSYVGDILEVEFTTPDYTFDKLLSLVDTEYMGYKVHITVPESVRNNPEKSAIRFNFGSLLDCMLSLYEMGGGRMTISSLFENGHNLMGWQETVKDTTVYINPWNQDRLNPDGSTYIDPGTGESIMLHTPIAPNEPTLFMAGEFEYGNVALHPSPYWGNQAFAQPDDNPKNEGFFWPMFYIDRFVEEVGLSPRRSDFVLDEAAGTVYTGEEDYWYGAHQNLYFKTKAPDRLDAGIEILVDNVGPIDASISFIPDEEVFAYSLFICNDATYNELVNDVLMGHEDWLEWFVCSFYAMRYLYVPTVNGPLPITAREFQGAPLAAENRYHILVSLIGDEDGSKMNFVHKTFETTAKTMDAPVVNVTAVDDNKHEYYATFNVKAPNKDVIRAYYAADYKREFILAANSGDQYEYLCQNQFSEEDIKMINSDAGLDVQIPSTDGQIVRMAVLAYNEEETKNALYSPEKIGPCSAVADCKTKLLDLVPRIESTLFEQLEGNWTATATMRVREYDKNNNLQEYNQKFSTNIQIMNQYELPALTQEVYDIYASLERPVSKEAVDGLYADLQKEVDIFNQYRLYYRNRLLCLGWFDYDYVNPSRLSLKDPFDLFTWLDYSSVDNAQAMYDFGPKWYLEIDKNGNVTLPFDQWETPPMVNWQSSVFFMGAYNQETNHGYKYETLSQNGSVLMPGEFPVEIVNKDKFIIKAAYAPLEDTFEAKTYPHYPNAIGGWGQADATIIRAVVSEITFTRGASGKSSAASKASRNCVERVELTGEDAQPVVVKSMTGVKDVEIPEFKQVTSIPVVDVEMLRAAARKHVEELRNR